MKITSADKELILKNGYTEEDFPQIEAAILFTLILIYFDSYLL